MNLDNHVTSLELSKHLYKLKVKQSSLFYWYKGILCFNENFSDKSYNKNFSNKSYAAFTVSELLELLPIWSDICKRLDNDYMSRNFQRDKEICHHSFDKNPCNSLAKMLIHLIENKLIEV